jgi:hypothetical protein
VEAAISVPSAGHEDPHGVTNSGTYLDREAFSECCVVISGGSMTTQDSGEAAEVAAKAGSFVEKVAAAGSPEHGTLGRIGKSAAAVKLGARVIPAFWRFVKRHPVGGSVAIVALVGMAYWVRTDYARDRSAINLR